MAAYHLLSARIDLGTPAAVATTPFGARVLIARLGRQGGRRWLGRGWSYLGTGRDPAATPLRQLGLLRPLAKQRHLQPLNQRLAVFPAQLHLFGRFHRCRCYTWR